jgi:hypothetical protein
MSTPKVYLNKADYIEAIVLPDGTESRRNFGVLPDLYFLADYEEKEIEIYDHHGNKIKDCKLLSVTKYKIKYDVIKNYTGGEE